MTLLRLILVFFPFQLYIEGKRSHQRVEREKRRDEGEIIRPEKSKDGACQNNCGDAIHHGFTER